MRIGTVRIGVEGQIEWVLGVVGNVDLSSVLGIVAADEALTMTMRRSSGESSPIGAIHHSRH